VLEEDGAVSVFQFYKGLSEIACSIRLHLGKGEGHERANRAVSYLGKECSSQAE